MSVPINWQEFSDQSSVTFAPKGACGVHEGQSVFTHGAIVGVVNSNSTSLITASEQYLSNLLQHNAYLRADRDYLETTLNGRQALRRRLMGTSKVTGRREAVNVYTTLLSNGPLLYVVHVVPEDESQKYARAFNDMIRSLRLLN